MYNLNNRTILVTGASRGIGRTLAEKLSDEGVRLILVARTEEKLKSFIKSHSDYHRYYVCDLADKKQTLSLVKIIKRDYKNIDVLINVAGIGIYKPFPYISGDEWDYSFALNVTAPFILTRELLPLLQVNSGSLVLNIGSGAGTIPMRGRSLYCATKFAMRGWTLSLAEEYQSDKPQFCLITLGSTLTGFGPMTIAEKEKEFKTGRAYFPVEWVVNKLVEIIKGDNRGEEIVLYPGDYGFGTWKKP